jgi:hypothetical protein
MDRVANTIARLINLLTPNESPRTRRLESEARLMGSLVRIAVSEIFSARVRLMAVLMNSPLIGSGTTCGFVRVSDRVLHYPRVARTAV